MLFLILSSCYSFYIIPPCIFTQNINIPYHYDIILLWLTWILHYKYFKIFCIFSIFCILYWNCTNVVVNCLLISYLCSDQIRTLYSSKVCHDPFYIFFIYIYITYTQHINNMSCHKTIVVITGRGHCFYDYMYIYTHICIIKGKKGN